MHFIVGQRRLDNFFRVTCQQPAIDPQRSVLTMKNTTAGASMHDLNSVVIHVSGPRTGSRIVRRYDFYRSGLVASQSPLRNIVVMGSHIGMTTSRVFLIGPPLRKMIVHATGAQDRVVG